MHPFKKVQTFTDKYPYIGPGIWILCAQYFAAQIYVARAWGGGFSWLHNTISDLGNTECAVYNQRNVCSPQHSIMNISFGILGIAMMLGALLIYREFKKGNSNKLGFSGMAAAGLGALMVGVFPENTISSLHYTGALLSFLVGNASILLLGFSLNIPKSLRYYTIATGIITLTALVFFITNFTPGVGLGGMERIVGYPQTLWLIVFGIYISRNHYMQQIRKKST